MGAFCFQQTCLKKSQNKMKIYEMMREAQLEEEGQFLKDNTNDDNANNESVN